MKTTDTMKTKGKGKAVAFAAGGDIPRRLSEYYDAIRQQPLPERFLDLLERLDEAERQQLARDAGSGIEPGRD